MNTRKIRFSNEVLRALALAFNKHPTRFNNSFMKPIPLLLTVLSLACAPSLVAQSFYSGPTFFSQRPDETKSLTTMDRFGPVGMAIDLISSATYFIHHQDTVIREIAAAKVLGIELIPEYVGLNRKKLNEFADAKVQNVRCGADIIDDLVGLHSRAGNGSFSPETERSNTTVKTNFIYASLVFTALLAAAAGPLMAQVDYQGDQPWSQRA